MRLKILRSPSCRLSFSMISISISIFMVTTTTNNTPTECSCGRTRSDRPIDTLDFCRQPAQNFPLFHFVSVVFIGEGWCKNRTSSYVHLDGFTIFSATERTFPCRHFCHGFVCRSRNGIVLTVKFKRKRIAVFANFQEHCERCELCMPKDVVATIGIIFNSSVCRRWSWKAL